MLGLNLAETLVCAEVEERLQAQNLEENPGGTCEEMPALNLMGTPADHIRRETNCKL
jgi:hypothetical protein